MRTSHCPTTSTWTIPTFGSKVDQAGSPSISSSYRKGLSEKREQWRYSAKIYQGYGDDPTVGALYTEGFCGGAVIPLGDLGRPANDVHLPLAHQSALAGVLLAAAGVRMGLSGRVDSVVTQYDVLKPQERFQVYPFPGMLCRGNDPKTSTGCSGLAATARVGSSSARISLVKCGPLVHRLPGEDK